MEPVRHAQATSRIPYTRSSSSGLVKEYSQYGYPTQELSYHGTQRPSHSLASNTISTLKYYPFSTVLIFVWVLYIGGLFWDLEKAVSIAHTMGSRPWHLNVLPKLLLTLFSQAHGPITVYHLSRLAISALQYDAHTPRTWRELFWLADKTWGDPVGIVFTFYGMAQARVRVSLVFFLFMITSLVAIATPLVLANAYRVESLIVDIPVSGFRPSTATPERMRALESYNQLAAGSGPWSTGQSVESLFHASTFVPIGAAREDGGKDLFLAGDVQKMDTTLPGIRYYGSCLVLKDDPVAEPEVSYNEFLATCTQAGFKTNSGANITTNNIWGSAAQYQWCGLHGVFDDYIQYSLPNASTTSTGLAWFSINNGSRSNPNSQVPTMVSQGIIQCDSTLQFGWADVNGTSMTMSNFVARPLFDNPNGGEPIVHPISAAMGMLSHTTLSSSTPLEAAERSAWMTRLGFNQTISDDPNQVLTVNQPTLADLAQHVWIGTTHMANSLVLLSTSNDQSFDAIQHATVASYARSELFFVLSVALIWAWGALMIGLTLLLWRPTFSSSLCSYSAARLLADHADLVEGHCCGDTEDNPKLNEVFSRVGDSVEEMSTVGHIAVGGQGELRRGRRFGLKQGKSS